MIEVWAYYIVSNSLIWESRKIRVSTTKWGSLINFGSFLTFWRTKSKQFLCFPDNIAGMRDGTGTLIRPRSTGICSSIPNLKWVGYCVNCTCQPQKQYWVISSLSLDKNTEEFCGHGKFDVLVDTYSKTLVSINHFASDVSVFWYSFT